SADATVANGHILAAGALGAGTIALVGTGLHGDGLRGLGLPLQSGEVAVAGRIGTGRASQPSFDGGVSVKDGRAQGYPVSGSATLALHDGSLQISNGVGSLGGAIGLIGGTIGALSSHAPTYAVRADVPAADVAGALRTLHLPGYETTGVFNAMLAIGGRGAAPNVSGPVAVPGGTVNGLPFLDASARLDADPSGLSARYGGALVGSTDLRFSAIARKNETAISVRAPHATLTDFNNFFDTGDTLAGVGAIAFSLIDNAGNASTSGDVDVKGFRYRALPIGDTIASWSSVRNVVNGRLVVSGPHGSLHLIGGVTLAPTTRLDRLVADSRYDATATLDNVDVSTWLPAIGYPEVPLLGRVDASARVRGAYPHLRIVGKANLTNGSFGRLPIDSLSAEVGSNGDSIVLQNAELSAPALAATAQGTIGLGKSMPIALSVHALSDDLPLLVANLTRQQIAIKGSFETTAQIGGTIAAPTYQAAFDASNVDAYGLVASSLFGSVRLAGNNLELRNAGATFTHGEATLAGTLPLRLSPLAVAGDLPLNFDLALTGVDPAALDAVFGDGTKLGGTLDGHVNLVGTLKQPRIYGRIAVANGSYVSNFERVAVTGTVGTITFDRTSATLDSFSAAFGTGKVRAKGTIAFAQGFGQFGDVNYRIDAIANGAQVDLPTYGRGTIDGTLALTRTPPGLAVISGSAAASDAVIPFSAFMGAQPAAGDAATSTAALPVDLGLDLKIKAGKNVRVRGGSLGYGLDIGATGAATLGGTLSKPTLDGSFTSTGGTLTYVDRAFKVQSGTVSFDPSNGVTPILRATGVTHIVNPDPNRTRNPYGSVDVTIKVDGPLSNLSTSFESSPQSYSKEQILALIAPFGGFVGGIAFDPATGQPTGAPLPGNLPGAPVANTGQALPGALVPQESGTITVGQEAFNILNAQFTSALISPIENALSQGLGLDSVDLTVDYFGNFGVDVRRRLGKYLNVVYATTFGIPTRQSVGLEYAPNDSTSAQLSAFFLNGPTRLYTAPGGNGTSGARVTAGQALQGNSGFSFTIQRLFW
ncbi:MAG: translocation/assembly module TamB domain-containing protein, partial [Candidatus Eremiobacteraeota bacterium]|nr:translocation/assembly module TamB domain-containing protein [Candidatus Eremiobacteraeota bacterium]